MQDANGLISCHPFSWVLVASNMQSLRHGFA